MTSLGLFLRGLLMGAADIVPGVSGGTMALITGIYPKLLDSIRSFDYHFVQLLLRAHFSQAWQHVNGSFLLAVVAGIAASLLSLARLLSWVLENHPVPLWAFFFGLILASAVLLLRLIERWTALRVVILLGGLLLAVSIALAPTSPLEPGWLNIFFAGFLAICAMILPGISGSFVLVLLGMYGPMLAALREFDVSFVLVFAVGAGCGLMCFSRLLSWLLARFYAATMALLTGFLTGSLLAVWPWKRVTQWATDSNGQLQAVQQLPVWPSQFQVYTGDEAQLLLCCLLMVFGFVMVMLLSSFMLVQNSENAR